MADSSLAHIVFLLLSAFCMLVLENLSAEAVVLRNQKKPPGYDHQNPPAIISHYAPSFAQTSPPPVPASGELSAELIDSGFFDLSRTMGPSASPLFGGTTIGPAPSDSPPQPSSEAFQNMMTTHLLPHMVRSGEFLEQNFNTFLDSMNDSSSLRTIYFNSLQLQFSFRHTIINALGEMEQDPAALDPLAYIDNSDSLGLIPEDTGRSAISAKIPSRSLVQQFLDNIKSIGTLLLSLVVVCYLLIHYVISKYI
ncbi:hypothetical protein [Luteithermobacter gelatinilyticus]|uniref:hypothetical protein n=1 Tax=Luteithermobacter gelatinilyticus TaxID=2582913 RepID=UPI0011062C8B|nr:hypothetical protein [Luteithermobacter gelatinilyticus]